MNPLHPTEPLHAPAPHVVTNEAHPPQPLLPHDSATTKAEKIERNGPEAELPPSKRQRIADDDQASPGNPRKNGIAPIKSEYLLPAEKREDGRPVDERDKKRAKKSGQNTSRNFGHSRDAIGLCKSRANVSEFAPDECPRGQNCRFEHDIRKYLRDGKREDLTTFDSKCPVWSARGKCNAGWRCRFASSHSEEKTHPDGKKELILTEDAEKIRSSACDQSEEEGIGTVNVVSMEHKISLRKRNFAAPKAESYTNWINEFTKYSEKAAKRHDHEDRSIKNENGGKGEDVVMKDDGIEPKTGVKQDDPNEQGDGVKQQNGIEVEDDIKHKNGVKHDKVTTNTSKADKRAEYVEPPFLPSEKRRIYYGPETPILAPLTTQGNLPFRRLCVTLGAQVTWSEMAMSLPLIQGEKPEWALMKAHGSELQSPAYSPRSNKTVKDYDHEKDIRFGAQISANKPWAALKATEVLTALCPHLRAIDLNCGCPIDLVYRQGAGSALMDSPGKLEKMVRGMNAVSGEIPVQIKIRTGTRDAKPTAERLVERFAYGGDEAADYNLGPAGVAAITLHGRSRQQRYTRLANWEYISDCAAIIKDYNTSLSATTDTTSATDPRDQSPNPLYFIGNGDCYSHTDYNEHIAKAGVDSVMVARGALIKPWIFEEIATGQHLDKSASERLAYVEQYARFGLEYWGSDEIGVGTTRRFLLEWLSFACRYVPVGLLEHMPPRINDRPPAYKGRNELETLLASDNVKDWVKISDMFLGPAHENFRFEPKHRSNSYEVEAEG